MSSSPYVTACIESLKSISDDPCHFRHEHAEFHDPDQCLRVIQETCLGCAHSSLVILTTAIEVLVIEELLASDVASSLNDRLQQTFHPVMHLDLCAKAEYEAHEDISSDTKTGERAIITERLAVRDQLLAIAFAA